MPDAEGPSGDRYVLNSIYPEAVSVFTGVLKPISDVRSNAIVVLDTNILLVPFSVSPKTLDEIGATYRKLAGDKRLVVPGQVAREFARLRANKLAELYQQLNDRKARLPSSGIGKHPLLERMSEFDVLLEKEQRLLDASKEYGDDLSKIAEQVRTWTWNDPVSDLYRAIFTADVVLDAALDRDAVDANLKYRATNAIPPGYKDNSKPDGGVGDLLIWHTILIVGEERKTDVIFVSGEEKADWWHRGGGRQLYPRFELVDEFRRRSGGKSFHIVSFAELLELYGASEDLVSEVRESEREGSEAAAQYPGSELDPDLKFALDQLPHSEKMVYLLADIEGFKYRQVAEILDMPVGSVGWRLHNARHAMNRIIAELRAKAGAFDFPAEPRWNIIHGSVDFPVQLGSARMIARVSEEALEDYFGATSAETMIPTFQKNRTVFEDVVRRKLLSGDFKEGVVLVSTHDFQSR